MENFQLLSQFGCDINHIHQSENRTPLLMAIKFGHQDALIEILNLGADPNFSPKDRYTPFIETIGTSSLEIVNTLTSYGADIHLSAIGSTPLMESIEHSKYDITKKLINLGVNINGTSDILATSATHEITPLMIAAQHKQSIYTQLLLDNGADINRNSKHGSALISAIKRDSIDNINLLIKSGINVDLPDIQGLTALMHSVLVMHEVIGIGVTMYGDENIIKIILEAGADIEIKNLEGETALDIAKRINNKEISHLLENYQLNLIAKKQLSGQEGHSTITSTNKIRL